MDFDTGAVVVAEVDAAYQGDAQTLPGASASAAGDVVAVNTATTA